MMLRVVVCWVAFLSTVQAVNLYEDAIEPPVEEIECYGTSRTLGSSGSWQYHYTGLRDLYENCTYVHGNLEITNLEDPFIEYDLSFLRHIRYVTGYVLISLVAQVPVVSLPSLEVIRGNRTYEILGNEYSLIVALNSPPDDLFGLTELHLPKLKEISNGKVLFNFNPMLCNVNVGSWAAILGGREDSLVFENHPSRCAGCSCAGGCQSPDADMCGPAPHTECHVTCPYRCFAPGPEGCCHGTCAVGCTGPRDSDCLVCKDFQKDGHCIPFCPPKTYMDMQECVPFE